MSRPQSQTEAPDFSTLVSVFQAGDPETFLSLAQVFPWASAEQTDVARGADMAVSLGLLPLARRLVTDARTRWPDDPRLAHIWSILRRPTVRSRPPIRSPEGLLRSQMHLAEARRAHPGQWLGGGWWRLHRHWLVCRRPWGASRIPSC